VYDFGGWVVLDIVDLEWGCDVLYGVVGEVVVVELVEGVVVDLEYLFSEFFVVVYCEVLGFIEVVVLDFGLIECVED